MSKSANYKTLGTIVDYANHTWVVYQSRPTDHGWPVLLGRPAMIVHPAKPIKGGLAIIMTKELAEYLQRHRILRTPLRLPIGGTAIHRLRKELGLNFINDYPLWWEQTRRELLRQEGEFSSSRVEFDDSDCPKTWTKAELERSLYLRAEGKTLLEIAAAMNKKIRAVDAVHRKVLGVQKPQQPWTKKAIKTLLSLKKEGHTCLEISKRMGRSKTAIDGMLARLFPGRGPANAWTTEEREELERLIGEGVSVRQIALALGKSYPAIVAMRGQLAQVTKKPRWTEQEKETLEKLLLSGVTQREAAAQLGKTEMAVCHMHRIMKSKTT